MKKTLRHCISLLLVLQLVLSPLFSGVASAQVRGGTFLRNLTPSTSTSRSYSDFSRQQNWGLPPVGSSQDTYFTDSYGNILMYVNVLGEVYKPGQHIVRQESDISSVLGLVGGPTEKANLKKAKLFRYKPDESGVQTYPINLKDYFKKGDRSEFVDLKPNDTLVIPEDKAVDTNTIVRIASLIVSVVSVYAIVTR